VKLYLLFLLMAGAAVLSPGPGVVMTLTNSLRHGVRGTLGGIIGIAIGALVVAAISATSVGVLLAASATAFTVLKLIGAGYLFYLAIRLWRAPALRFTEQPARPGGFAQRLLEGLTLQLTNPKAIFFFLSVFPQFIDPAKDFALQFTTLVLTYSALVVVIHTTYAVFAKRTRRWLASERGGCTINLAASATFVFFGTALAIAKR